MWLCGHGSVSRVSAYPPAISHQPSAISWWPADEARCRKAEGVEGEAPVSALRQQGVKAPQPPLATRSRRR
eukprot:scaffold114259_cov31-Tisochrysis_lutea.AAC.4